MKSSLFASRRGRNLVIAAIMLVLLGGSLAGAYALTASLTKDHGEETGLVRFRMGHLQLSLPRHWRQSPLNNLPPELQDGVRFIDPDRRSRQLTLVRLVSKPPQAGLNVLRAILPHLLDARARRSFKSAVPMGFSRHGLRVTEWIGASQGQSGAHGGARARIHIAVDFTPDEQVHWVIYLTDAVLDKENGQTVLQNDRLLLRAIDLSASLVQDKSARRQE